MGTGDLTRGLPDDAVEQVSAYLSRLDAALPLLRHERARILAEAADALKCEIDAAVAGGKAPSAAACEAVDRFGAPAMLAAEFAAALTPHTARRVGLALMVSGPLIGLVWVTAIGHGQDLAARISSVLTILPYLPILLAVTAICAMVAILAGRSTTGSHGRVGLVSASGAAWLAARGCVLADAVLLAMAWQHLRADGAGSDGWLAVAAALSLLRLAGAATAERRLSRLRAAAR